MRTHAGVIAPPPLIFLAGFLSGALVQLVVPLTLRDAWSLRVVSYGFLAAGIVVALMGFGALRKAKTAILPHRETTTLVSSGIYSRTRNPLYLAMTFLYLAAVGFTGWLMPLVLLPLTLWVVRRGVIDREESYLAERFGETYEAYRQAVPRWL